MSGVGQVGKQVQMTIHGRLEELRSQLSKARRALADVADNVRMEGDGLDSESPTSMDNRSLDYQLNELFKESRYIGDLVNHLSDSIGQATDVLAKAAPKRISVGE